MYCLPNKFNGVFQCNKEALSILTEYQYGTTLITTRTVNKPQLLSGKKSSLLQASIAELDTKPMVNKHYFILKLYWAYGIKFPVRMIHDT
jgi:hypothetical protein